MFELQSTRRTVHCCEAVLSRQGLQKLYSSGETDTGSSPPLGVSMKPDFSFMPSFNEVEAYARVHESLSFKILQDMRHDPEVFYDFMDSLCHEDPEFHAFAELLKDFVLDDREYLDRALNLRAFLRSGLILFSEEKAHRVLSGEE